MEKLKRKLFWNYYIRLIFETTLELVFAGYLNVLYSHVVEPGFVINSEATYSEWINFSFAVFLFFIVVAQPVLIILFYCKYYGSLGDEEFE